VDSPIPKPGPDEVVIKVVYAGSNPKDWKIPEFMGMTGNQGDDIAGTVHEVGSDVTEFKPGTSDIPSFNVHRSQYIRRFAL
jgi:NADPH2:quinone reductase